MLLAVVGGLLALVALPFLIRGWIFTLAPQHALTEAAKERNLRMGLETDMKVWGRKVRRFGLLLLLAGGGLTYWGITLIG